MAGLHAPASTSGESRIAILKPADVERYRRIFALQEAGSWTEADADIARLNDPVLLGHLQAQRYLHPTAYRSKYQELKTWLDAYADHPDAGRIYKLAMRRKPSGHRRPAAPTYGTPGYGSVGYADRRRSGGGPRGGLSQADREDARRVEAQIHRFLRQGATLSAKRLLQEPDTARLLSRVSLDRARARLGTGYFADGRDAWALEWAGQAIRSAEWVPEALWTTGLAAWRLDRIAEAGGHFETLAARDDVSPWLVSAAAFWAARTHLRQRQPADADRWLEQAAGHPRTFYGILARRLLGLDVDTRWAEPEKVAAWTRAVGETAAGRRSLALLQVGQYERAERDLLGLAAVANDEGVSRGILAVAGLAGLPELAIRLDGVLFPDGGGYDGAAYPLPAWTPEEGFHVDRALVYALVRQESRFNPRARSPAGASGLMQIMPRTASWVAGDRTLHGANRSRLLDPALNLSLGQRYIQMLLDERDVGGDLLRMMVAWNGGPGNLSKWLKNTKHHDDPLLFIEGITRRETRVFAEKVLSNFWIYRDRLGQETPSLDAIAAGQWPAYTPQDGPGTEVATNEPARR